jgi:TonB family protein
VRSCLPWAAFLVALSARAQTSFKGYWPLGAKDGVLALTYVGDSVWIYAATATGPFTFHADSFAMASWAEAAAGLEPPAPKASRVTYYDAPLKSTEVFDLIRTSDEPASPYQLVATVGAWKGVITLSPDSAQRLFLLLHGRPQSAPKTPPDPKREPYFDFQVEKQARPVPGGAQPAYPVPARNARLEGVVLAQFIIDTTGLVEMPSLRILKSTNPWFVAAIYETLPWMKFVPAQVHGQNVRELVQQPYAFNLTPR